MNIIDNKYFGSLPQGSNLFIAEGGPEVGLLQAIGHSNSANTFVTMCKGHSHLPVLIKSLGPFVGRLKGLFLFFDAETSYVNRIASITGTLSSAGIQYRHSSLDPHGIFRGTPDIGIFISPDNKNPGKIEDIISNEISGSTIANCISTFAQCVGVYDSKLTVQAFISAKSPGLCGAQNAFGKGVLDSKSPVYSTITAMVRNL